MSDTTSFCFNILFVEKKSAYIHSPEDVLKGSKLRRKSQFFKKKMFFDYDFLQGSSPSFASNSK